MKRSYYPGKYAVKMEHFGKLSENSCFQNVSH